jgi:hypothetical protein
MSALPASSPGREGEFDGLLMRLAVGPKSVKLSAWIANKFVYWALRSVFSVSVRRQRRVVIG